MTPAPIAERRAVRRFVALLSIGLVLAGPIASAGAETRLHGSLIDSNGRGASGYGIRLIGPDGAVSERRTASDGSYRFDAVAVGLHTVVIAEPAVTAHPVQVSSLHMVEGTTTRADFKLLDASSTESVRAEGVAVSAKSWWSDLTKPAKIWTALVIVSAGVLVAAGIDDDEEAATPF